MYRHYRPLWLVSFVVPNRLLVVWQQSARFRSFAQRHQLSLNPFGRSTTRAVVTSSLSWIWNINLSDPLNQNDYKQFWPNIWCTKNCTKHSSKTQALLRLVRFLMHQTLVFMEESICLANMEDPFVNNLLLMNAINFTRENWK